MSKLGLLRSRALGLTAALSMLANMGYAAEPAETEQRRAEAQAHFERGLELANVKRDWQGALDEFLRSRSLLPRRSATRNAAIALRELGRFAEALELYQVLFAEFGAEMPPDQLAAARADEQALRGRVGAVELSDAEPGTSLAIDGKARGETPLRSPITLDVGVHTLRLAKEGRVTLEQQIRVVPRVSTVVSARLKPLENSGVLFVSEGRGEALEVLVDGVPVGFAPWRGPVSVGRHSVALRGPGRGTAPASAHVKLRAVTELRLEAVVLDATATLSPKPEGANVFVDGVFVGTGIWQGPLPSGPHRFEALAPGYRPFRREVLLAAGERAVVPALLAEDLPPPPPPLTGLFVEGVVGPMFGRSAGGSLSSTCRCTSHSQPFGWQAQLRVGYEVARPLAVDLSGGWVGISESAVRRLRAPADYSEFVSDDYLDEVRTRAPFAMLGARLRAGQGVTVTSRLSAGVGRVTLTPSNQGTFSGLALPEDAAPRAISSELSVFELPRTQWAGLASAELRGGYRVTRRLSIDVGVMLTLLAMPRTARQARYLTFPDAVATADEVGTLRLPAESTPSLVFALTPMLAVRFDL